MATVTVHGVKVEYDNNIVFNKGEGWSELELLVQEEIGLWKQKHKELHAMQITLTPEGELEIKATEKSPIRRIRRITGYLSTEDRFGDAKRQELWDRRDHMEGRLNYLREV